MQHSKCFRFPGRLALLLTALLLLSSWFSAPVASADTISLHGSTRMKVTIIYDNTAFRPDLKANWGFAALVEAHGRRILFDTGTRGALLLSNMRRLGIDPASIDDVFISHAHFDHTGGLSAFLKQNSAATLWVPPAFRGSKRAREVVRVPEPRTLYPGIHSTGQLDGIEQSLCIETDLGIIIITGCSHPAMQHILSAAGRFGEVYGIIGGLHGTSPETLKGLQLICATHCTRHKQAIQNLYPDAYTEGGAGRVLEIGAAVTAQWTSRPPTARSASIAACKKPCQNSRQRISYSGTSEKRGRTWNRNTRSLTCSRSWE